MERLGFNENLHALRGEGLRSMPPGARTVLSAGCAGSWYFRWIAENYPGIERHIGLEAYSPKPDDLPQGVEWIANTVSDMRAVPDASVDLLFSGQNIEHLVEQEITGFLCEARRVVAPGGWLVLDSPNRAMTQRLGWFQPEHIIELTVDEIRELVELAGFDVVSIAGLWQCYDPVRHRLLPLDPGEDEAENAGRAARARDDPENAFVWWLTARRSDRPPERARIEARVRQIAASVFPLLATRFMTQVGRLVHAPLQAEAIADRGVQGFVLYGPYTPLVPGRYVATFRFRSTDAPGMLAKLSNARVARVDASSTYRGGEYAARDVFVRELAAVGQDGYATIALPFTLDAMAFGVEFRALTDGVVGLAVAAPVTLARISD